MTVRGIGYLAFFAVVASHLCLVRCSPEMIEQMGKGFSKAVAACQAELNLPEAVYNDMKNYWNLDYDLTNRDFGCLIVCLSKKLDLIDEEGKLHHGNAKDFAIEHGADEKVAQQVIDIVHGCEQQSAGGSDPCMVTLEIAKCFRAKIHDLKWAPSMEVLLDEVLAEI
nr:general odorant-binding protein 1-like [Metisa plana]